MPGIDNISPDVRHDLVERLKRIEGQARGIQKMILEGRDCEQIMNQISAMKAASQALSGEMLEAYALYCLTNSEEFSSPEKAVEKMVSVMMRSSR